MLNTLDSKNITYLLQEDERMFYPYGDERFLAESVMKNTEINFVINSNLLFNHLVYDGFDNIKKNGICFEPAFPKDIYCPRINERKNKKIFFFYARPHNSRNLFYIGTEVITRAVAKGILNVEEWDICFVGKDVPDLTLDGLTKPIILSHMSWSEYSEFIGTVDLGLSLMCTPHPSYPPLDLAASGAVVVTNRFLNKTSLEQYSNNIICADLDIDALVNALEQGVLLSENATLRFNNVSKNKLQLSWLDTLDQSVEFIKARV